MPLIYEWVVNGFFAFVSALLAAVLGLVWSLGRRVDKLAAKSASRLSRVDEDLRDTRRQVHGLTGSMQAMLRLVVDGKLLPVGKVLDVAFSFDPLWQAEVQREQRTNNPLTPEELARFEAYRVKLMERREMLAPEELEDYQVIVNRLHDDRPDDTGIWLLMGLGLILVGIRVFPPSGDCR